MFVYFEENKDYEEIKESFCAFWLADESINAMAKTTKTAMFFNVRCVPDKPKKKSHAINSSIEREAYSRLRRNYIFDGNLIEGMNLIEDFNNDFGEGVVYTMITKLYVEHEARKKICSKCHGGALDTTWLFVYRFRTCEYEVLGKKK